MVAKKSRAEAAKPADSFVWPFGRKNYILLGVSLLVIIIGYICLGYGEDPNNAISLTVAPIVLVIGYAMIPFAILARDRSGEEAAESSGEADQEADSQ
ncbi:DUF3098 domain-containing protein [candidate division GN15 bacterium]|nr:DUF3098 domain-containing protein [candidate division GN15 bacterium]